MIDTFRLVKELQSELVNIVGNGNVHALTSNEKQEVSKLAMDVVLERFPDSAEWPIKRIRGCLGRAWQLFLEESGPREKEDTNGIRACIKARHLRDDRRPIPEVLLAHMESFGEFPEANRAALWLNTSTPAILYWKNKFRESGWKLTRRRDKSYAAISPNSQQSPLMAPEQPETSAPALPIEPHQALMPVGDCFPRLVVPDGNGAKPNPSLDDIALDLGAKIGAMIAAALKQTQAA